MLISGSLPPNSRLSFMTGWMCRVEVEGLPVASPRRWTKSFWRSFVRLSWALKKTTPRRETVSLC